MEQEMAGLAGLLYELGLLKRYKRTGWLVAGVTSPESVADHSGDRECDRVAGGRRSGACRLHEPVP